jgi:ribosomal protein S18 acetylase RimI-like enzyme
VDGLELSDDLSRVYWAVLAEVIERAPLGTRDPSQLERAFRGSYHCCFAYHEGKLIGAARAISDGVSHSALYDVVVLPEYQGQGVGSRIVQFLLERLPDKNVMLVSVPDKAGFYERLGFRRLRTAYARLASPDAWQALGYFDGEPVSRRR